LQANQEIRARIRKTSLFSISEFGRAAQLDPQSAPYSMRLAESLRKSRARRSNNRLERLEWDGFLIDSVLAAAHLTPCGRGDITNKLKSNKKIASMATV